MRDFSDDPIWKQSEFNVAVSSFFGDEVLSYNTRTGAFRAWDTETWETVQQALDAPGTLHQGPLVDTLANMGMIVPVARQERQEMEQTYLKSKSTRSGTMLTITTTITCNFGCAYCFQSHSREKMKEGDSEAILSFLRQKLNKDSYLSITWFGGEPLMNFDFIEKLCPQLEALAKERNCTFHHSIITNGYLLDEKVLARFKALAPLSYVQITLDGGEASHDTRRVLLSGRGTYGRIFDNVERAAGFAPIHIRVNVDHTNKDELTALADDYFARGLDKKNVHIYLAHTRAYTENSDGLEDSELTKAEFADLSMKFEWYMFQRGYLGGLSLPSAKGGSLCTADTEGSYVMSPSGRLFKCWNEAAITDPKDYAGTLAPDGTVELFDDQLSHWEDHNPFQYAECQSCKVQPLCKGGCPWEAKKRETLDIGDCSALKWTLPDKLRLYRLKQALGELEPSIPEDQVTEATEAREMVCPD